MDLKHEGYPDEMASFDDNLLVAASPHSTLYKSSPASSQDVNCMTTFWKSVSNKIQGAASFQDAVLPSVPKDQPRCQKQIQQDPRRFYLQNN
jgi:hypothetical protein